MKDIARMAGTSLSTVSRSLNDHHSISKTTRDKIKALAEMYDFEINTSARSLATSRNSTIGVIYPESMDNEDNFYYAGMLLRNIREILEEAGLDPIVTFTKNRTNGESNIRRLILQGKVDGILLIQPEFEPSDYGAIEKSGLPFVLLHFLPYGFESRNINYVYADHELGGYLATQHLLQHGCRHILCITERERQFKERTAGYRRAHAEAGVPVYEQLVHSCDATYSAGYEAVQQYKTQLDEIDGIFVQADITAFGVMESLATLGVKIPKDLLLVGYDDIRMSSLISPQLTTVHQPHKEIVRSACIRLVELLEGADQSKVLQKMVKPYLVVRDTAPTVLPGLQQEPTNNIQTSDQRRELNAEQEE
ncbi:MAG TPA: LacI family DNA-binding transcriptional regulator [Clostridia bacterium]|nr:LacI family DNA-binding transcriptional regulator [Clostridia bacterium]